MSNIHVFFAIRLRSDEVMAQIGERVGNVLSCSFIASQDPEYPDEMIMEAEAFCVRLELTRWVFYEDPRLWVYQLNGENIIKPRWDYSSEMDLADWMLQEFRKRDSPDWYIPTLHELKKEAGID